MKSLIAYLLSVSACLALCYCAGGDKVAGGFDDVENPALKVSLLDTNNQAYGTGEIRLYARYEDPILDSTPLVQQTLAAGASASLSDTVILAAMQAAKARGTPWPTQDTIEVNLLARSAEGEAFIDGIFLVKSPSGKYHMRRRLGSSIGFPNTDGTLEVTPVMKSPVLAYHGRVGQAGLDLKLKSIFIPGSPYWASVQTDGSFVIPRLAQDHYEVKALSQDAKVYSAPDPLFTGTEYLPSDWTEADLIWIGG